MLKKYLTIYFAHKTSSFYGMKSWYDSGDKKHVCKMGVTYHKAVKMVENSQVWGNNNETCTLFDLPIFRHLLAERILSFFKIMCSSKTSKLSPLKYYLRYRSNFYKLISDKRLHVYGINHIFSIFCSVDWTSSELRKFSTQYR